MSSLKAQGAKAFLWDFFGKLAKNGMSFIVSIFLARLLEISDFGMIAMVMVIIGIAQVFTDIGLGGALIQRRRVLPIHYSSVFYFNVFIASILSLITYFSASWIGNFYNNTELVPLAEVMSLSFIIAAFSSVQNVKLRKELNYALLTKMSLIASLISGIIGVSLAFYGSGVWSLVAQSLSQGIIYNVLIWSTANWKPSLEFSFKALIQLWGYGFRMFLSGLLDAIFTRLDYLIIGKLFEATALGFFQRAKSLNLFVVQYSSGSLMSVLFPVLSKVQNDLPRFQNIVIKALGIISFITFMLLGGLYLISEELIVLLFGEKWLPSVMYFKILVLAGYAYPISALLVNVLSSRGNSRAFLRLEIYKKIISSVSFIVLYYYGIVAFLYSSVTLVVFSVSLNIIFVSREISLPFSRFAKPILTQAGLAIISVMSTIFIVKNLALVDIIMLIIKGSLFTFMYIGLNYLFKTSSFHNFLEQIMPMVRKKSELKQNMENNLREIEKITIVNAHWSNRGDEAALLAVVEGLQKNYSNSQITILFKDDKKIQQFPNIENVDYDIAKFNAKIWDIWLTTLSRGIFGLNGKLKFMVKTLLKSDLIVYSPGGSVINSRFFWRKQMEYLVPFICAKFYNIPLLIAAPSIGPFDSTKPNRILKWLLKVPEVFVVREEISRRYLEEIGIVDNIITTIDSAFYDGVKEEENQKKLDDYTELKEYLSSYEKVVGITITDFSWHVKYGKDKELSQRITDSFRKFLEKLQNEGYGILFIPQLFGNQNDSDYMDTFSTDKTFMMKDTYDTYFQQYIISKLYAVEGMRYHSNIFSAKMGTPFIPVVYEEKMEGFIEIAGLNGYSISLDELSFEKLEEKFEKLNDNYSEVKYMFKSKLLSWKKQASKTIKLLGEYR